MSSRYNPDEININDLTDFIHAMSTSTSSSTYDTTTTSSSTSFALLQDEEPQYRSIIFPEETHTQHPHTHQHINPKQLQDVNLSLDSFGLSPSDEAAEYFAANARLHSSSSTPLSHITSLHPPSSTSIFSPHTPPSFEQQASTHSLPPSSPTLSTDSSSSSSLSQSYSQSHLDSELPTHDALMRNDSCISVYHEISHRRDDEIDVVEDEDTCDTCMPDADSDELPPPGVYPRLMRQNGIYRQPSIAGY